MKQIVITRSVEKYEVYIKSAILLTALLLFTYSFKNQTIRTGGYQKFYEHTHTK